MTKERSPFVSFCMGGLSGGTAVVLSNPFEVVKTRYQLQGELAGSQKVYRSMLHALSRIVREEGLLAMQKGLAAGIVFQVGFNGLRIGLFDHIKPLVHFDSAPSLSKLLAGASTGCLAAATCSPLYMVKCRLQSQATGAVATAVGTQHGYAGVLHGLTSIYREAGIRGLYVGVDGFVMRTAVGSAFQLSVFDAAKEPAQQQLGSWWGTVGAAGLAGACATTAMNPNDVVATRLYNQPRLPCGRGALYSGPVDCLAKSVRAEGIASLYSGWLSHTCRLVPHTIYCLVFFEKVKQLADWFGI